MQCIDFDKTSEKSRDLCAQVNLGKSGSNRKGLFWFSWIFPLLFTGYFFLFDRKWLLTQLQKDKITKEVIETIGHSASSDMPTSHLHHDFLAGNQSSSESRNNVAKLLSSEMQENVLKEFEVCSDAAAKYPNNYNAWSHRIWLIRNICHCSEEVGKSFFSSTRDYWFPELWPYNCGNSRQFFLSFCTRYWTQKCVIRLVGWREISRITVATTTDSLFFMRVTI